MNTKRIQKIGGICAILEAFIYITAFVIYGGVLVFPDANAGAVEKLNFLSDNYILLSIVNFISYVLCGILLLVLVFAIHQRLKKSVPNVSKLAFIFGIIWVGMAIASGMISNVGLTYIVNSETNSPENIMQIWSSISIVTEGLGGGNEILGGIWVLLISIIAFQKKLFSKGLVFLGIIVGIAGILTTYPLDVFTEIFGISQIVWFLWIGIFMIRKSGKI